MIKMEAQFLRKWSLFGPQEVPTPLSLFSTQFEIKNIYDAFCRKNPHTDF